MGESYLIRHTGRGTKQNHYLYCLIWDSLFMSEIATASTLPAPSCAVIGYGSWATALVKILIEGENFVHWYIPNPDVRNHLQEHHTNPKYLSQIHLESDLLTLSDDLNAVVRQSRVVLLAVPSAFLVDALKPLTEPLHEKFFISAIKGIVPDGYLTVAEWLNRRYAIPFERIGILTGPCHAEEVAQERLSYLTMVCQNEEHARLLARRVSNSYIRVTTSTDIYGTEYAAVLKNIYAIAAGICHGLGYGDNFQAVLISNAALEMERFLNATFDLPRNICKSAYLGDLLVTCYSQFSRNRTFGIMIGKGYSVKAAQMEMSMVAEGYYATACIHQQRTAFKVEMPIVEAIHGILYEGKSPAKEIKRMLEQLT